MYVDWGPSHLSLVLCFAYTYLYPFLAGINNARNAAKLHKSPAFELKRTLGMLNATMFYSIQSIWLSLLIGFNT